MALQIIQSRLHNVIVYLVQQNPLKTPFQLVKFTDLHMHNPK